MSKSTDDLKKFQELSENNPRSRTVENNRGDEPVPGPKGEVLRSSDSMPGRPVQWALNGPGYIPVGRTIRTLKPGAYRIESHYDRATFVQVDLHTDNLIRLPDSRSDDVIEEIEHFWTLKPQFEKYGFSHKRGFLLFGPPGSGKTSTVQVVISEMVKKGGLVVIATVGPGLLASMLQQLRLVEPNRPVVVIMEDIDAIIKRWGESELLSLLDGELSITNVTFVGTTNYPEELDPRLTNRPSRFDRVVFIDMPSAEARLVYLKSRNLDISLEEMQRWVALTQGFSLAHLKELIVGVLCYGNDLIEEVERLRAMEVTPKSTDGRRKAGFQGAERTAGMQQRAAGFSTNG